jgi:HEAT repeat protein
VPTMMALARDGETLVSLAAFEAVAAIPKPEVVEFLVAQLGAEFSIATKAKRALTTMGPPVEDAVLKQLDSTNNEVVTFACSILETIGTEKSLGRLRELANGSNPDFHVQSRAKSARDAVVKRSGSGSTLSAGKPAIDPFPPAPKLPPDAPVSAAIPAGRPATDPFPLPKTSGDDPIAAAILAMGQGDAGGARAVAELARTAVVENRRAEVSAALLKFLAAAREETAMRSAIRSLAVWHTPETVPALAKYLGHTSFSVRSEAASALASIKSPAAAKSIAARLASPHCDISAAAPLSQMGPVAEDAVLALLSDANQQTRATAIGILGDIGTKKSLRALEKIANGKDFFLKGIATMSVQRVRERGQ